MCPQTTIERWGDEGHSADKKRCLLLMLYSTLVLVREIPRTSVQALLKSSVSTRNPSWHTSVVPTQHTSAYVSIRQTSAYDSIRQHTSAYVSIRQQKSDLLSFHAFFLVFALSSLYLALLSLCTYTYIYRYPPPSSPRTRHMRHWATSVWGLQLLVYSTLSY